jgi:pyruvate/2-oxoglutarate dehydrogenase complex dihydrolipoamide acyltransferase (E2) component
MAEFFKMPQATPTMEVGTISKWRKAEGEALKPQDVVAEVETDKAVMEIEVFDSAVLLKILVEAGVEVPAGRPIAILGKSGGGHQRAARCRGRAGRGPFGADPGCSGPRCAGRRCSGADGPCCGPGRCGAIRRAPPLCLGRRGRARGHYGAPQLGVR